MVLRTRRGGGCDAHQPQGADGGHPQQGGAGDGAGAPAGRYGPHRPEPIQQRDAQNEQVSDGTGGRMRGCGGGGGGGEGVCCKCTSWTSCFCDSWIHQLA